MLVAARYDSAYTMKWCRFMKKILLVLCLLPLNALAYQNIAFGNSKDCRRIEDLKAKKQCLDEKKSEQAKNNFKNFEENKRSSYQEEF